MNPRPILAAALLVGGVLLLGYLMLDRDPVALLKLPEAPRGPVTIDSSVPQPNLLGLGQSASPHTVGEAARIERNRLAQIWIDGLADLKAHRTNQGAVERMEMDVWVQRLHTKEVTPQAAHRALAELIARELARRKRLLAQGFASPQDVREAEVLLARERYAAGDPDSGYAQARDTYLAARRTHFLMLVRSKLMLKDVADVEIHTLEQEFPDPATLRPAPLDPA